uniref:Major capsid protein n=1 Tax=Dulem virus 198 TaxID=3145675 RepID=A0AAU8AYD9_9VIRU
MRNMDSRFAINPQVNIERSKFNRDSSVKTSFNVGDLIPFYLDEVLPGDTFQVRTSLLARLQPLVTAPMDNLYLDTYYFFVPNRLVWEHWRELNGENTESAWIPQTEYQVPQITSPASTGWNIGTIADYFGLPTGVAGLSVSALPFRAYSLIVNEWFRDQNLKDPLETPKSDATVAGVNTGNYITDCAKGGLPFKAAKLHDYFTSCLPSPQKGPDVTVTVADGLVPVRSGEVHNKNGSSPMTLSAIFRSGGSGETWNMQPYFASHPEYGASATLVGMNSGDPNAPSQNGVTPNNLYADFANAPFTVATVNQLRMAFQIQKMYEKDARGGTRYQEMIKSHFGVTSPDARLQRPEYLGGERLPININQVIQNSSSVTDSPQGNVAGMSVTQDSHGDFIRSFTEHGLIIGLCVARYEHTYQQGINRLWSKKSRTDFYLPVLANIGEQPVFNKEIYAQGSASDEQVFGYQEAWADYRYKPSIVTGEMRSNHNKTLDSWHFADDYDTLPHLSSSWIDEDKSPVDRALAVQSSVANQIFVDFFIQNETTRPMPVYSIPGLIDHH